MTLSFFEVALISAAYLTILFAIAYSTERGWVSDKIVSHQVTYIFSLGIFASAWSFYGVIDLAHRYGYGALAYYLGYRTILDLRSEAERELGDRFDQRGFHDTILNLGSVPLPVLEQEVRAFIAAQKRAPAP